MTDDRSVEEELPRFLERCQVIVDRDHPTARRGRPAPKLMAMPSRRGWCVKIVDTTPEGSPSSAFCFVDRTTGDVCFASSWSKPGPVRGSIWADDEEGLGIRWYGTARADDPFRG